MKLFPQSSSRQTSTPSSIGSIVLYENDNAVIVGVITGTRSQRHTVLNERGATIELPPMRLHFLPGRVPDEIARNDLRAQHLASLHEASRKQTIPLEELWEFVREDEREYTTTELCQLYFGKDQLADHLALHVALIGDKTYFKRKVHNFVPRPPHVVEELARAEKARREHELIHRRFIEAAQARVNDPHASFPPETLGLLQLLEGIACDAPHLSPAQWKEAKGVLQRCSEELRVNNRPLDLDDEFRGSESKAAFGLLLRLGVFSKETNPALHRYPLPASWSTAADESVQQLNPPQNYAALSPAEQARRIDATHLTCITIDDVSTMDMDDALSVEPLPDGYRLGIHISEVSAFVPMNTALDEEARTRATSLYLPDRTHHMFPERISTDLASLVEGVPRRAMSCFFDVDRQFSIKSGSLARTLIRVRHKLSYAVADELLDGARHPEIPDEIAETLSLLYQMASSHESTRLERGALKVARRDVIVRRDSTGHLSLEEYDEDSPARALVGEMMVMANILLASTAARAAVPFIYRSQEPPDRREQIDPSIPEGRAREYHERGGLKRSITSLTPAPHSSLGVELYTQASSPIRRYSDLLNQRQLVAHLEGVPPPYSATELSAVLEMLNEPLARAQTINKESKRFWILRYLEQELPRRSLWRATVLRTDLRNPLIEINEVCFTTLLRTPHSLTPGQEIEVRINSVEPRLDLIRLELANSSTPSPD